MAGATTASSGADIAIALAWPVSIIVAALFVYLIVRRLTPAGKLPTLHLPNGMRFSGAADVQTAATVPSPEKLQPTMITDAAQADPAPSDQSQVSNESTENGEGSWEWLETKDPEQLERLFEEFRSRPDFMEHEELYTTHLIYRRREVGAGGGLEEFRNLANERQDWIQPLIWLAHDSINSGDADAASKYLSDAEERSSEKNFGDVVTARIDLLRRLDGHESVLKYLGQLNGSGASDSNKARGYLYYAGILRAADRKREAIPLYEEGLRLDPSRHSHRFDLAHSYAALGNNNALAFYHYNMLLSADYDKEGVNNNIGVIMSSISNARLQNHFYEAAVSGGNPLAVANLAHNLVEAGMPSRAIRLLDEHADLKGHEENRTSARTKALTSLRLNTDDTETYWQDARKEHLEYVRLIRSQRAYLSDELKPTSSGTFASEGDSVSIKDDKADVKISINGVSFEGSVPFNIFIYEGTVMSKGGSLITTEFRDVALAQVGDDEVRVLVYPKPNSLKVSEVRNLKRDA